MRVLYLSITASILRRSMAVVTYSFIGGFKHGGFKHVVVSHRI